MSKNEKIWTIIASFISIFIVIISYNPNNLFASILGISHNVDNPKQLYHIYLEGKSLGVISSKKELEDYIDNKQEELKKKYSVKKVYAPNDLDIIKEITYNEKLSTSEEIYKKIEKIKGSSSFTIDGYKIIIKGTEKTGEDGEKTSGEDVTLYTLEKDVFVNSVEKTVRAFIPEEDYDNYSNDKQVTPKENETGRIIENIYIDNNITIRKERIPAAEKIYQTEEDLTKMLLFGTTEEQEKYTVEPGDTIEDISNTNKLSTEEFLIANTNFKTSSDLLYPGQIVNLGLIQPQFDLVEVEHVVSKKEIGYTPVYENDENQYVGYEEVKQEGKNGLALVTEKIKLVNGEIKDLVQTSNIELTAPVNKVIVRGTKRVYGGATGSEWEVPVGVGSWVWPTTTPYTISSWFGYRWRKFHEGIDISGAGYGSPIKAANNGVVVESSYTKINGIYTVIKHANGYYTMYAHMASRFKKVGDVVMAADQIGTMGNTGYAFGVHLHFAIYNGYPYQGGKPMNPLTTVFSR